MQEELIKNTLRQYFNDVYGIELTDSPQVLENYLYIEFWLDRGERKLRIPYSIDKEDFLKMSDSDLINWVEREVFKEIITLL